MKTIKCFLQTDLKFTTSGHFTRSPYCVTLQAREVIRGRIRAENASVCVFTNQAIASKGVELLPEPARLRASEDKNKKARKITSNLANPGDSRVSSGQSIVVDYPNQVEVLQNASDYARVVEPVEEITDNKIK